MGMEGIRMQSGNGKRKRKMGEVINKIQTQHQALTLFAADASEFSEPGDFRFPGAFSSSGYSRDVVGVRKFKGLGSMLPSSLPTALNPPDQSPKKEEGEGSSSPDTNRLGRAERGVWSGGGPLTDVGGGLAKGFTGPVPPALRTFVALLTLGDGGGSTTEW